MKVIPFQTGPILGATDAVSARIFGRGEPEFVDGQPRRAHAVIRTFDVKTNTGAKPRYFKLNPNFDMSAVCVLDGLEGATPYHYQAGYFFSEVDSDDVNVDQVLDWSAIAPIPFKTGSTSTFGLMTIAFGSCRYAIRINGQFDDRGDKIFRSIADQHDKRPIDAVIMAGDQIYADDLNFLSPDKTLDEYLQRYRAVFSQPSFARLVSRVPTYMTLDDHEIEDNWPAKAQENDKVHDLTVKLPAAMHAYQIYQLSHSPLFPVVKGKIAEPPKRLWYTHRDGCCDFFLSDSRTERQLDKHARAMFSPAQLDALLDWLAADSERVKVLVTSVPFWEAGGDDKWDGFVQQRDVILEHIRTRQIRRVLILSGDVHASMSSELRISGDPSFKVVSVVSSPFFWPYIDPFRHSFRRSGPIPTGSQSLYLVDNASTVIPDDSYTILRIQLDRVGVDVFSRKGELLSTKDHLFF